MRPKNADSKESLHTWYIKFWRDDLMSLQVRVGGAVLVNTISGLLKLLRVAIDSLMKSLLTVNSMPEWATIFEVGFYSQHFLYVLQWLAVHPSCLKQENDWYTTVNGWAEKQLVLQISFYCFSVVYSNRSGQSKLYYTGVCSFWIETHYHSICTATTKSLWTGSSINIRLFYSSMCTKEKVVPKIMIKSNGK